MYHLLGLKKQTNRGRRRLTGEGNVKFSISTLRNIFCLLYITLFLLPITITILDVSLYSLFLAKFPSGLRYLLSFNSFSFSSFPSLGYLIILYLA